MNIDNPIELVRKFIGRGITLGTPMQEDPVKFKRRINTKLYRERNKAKGLTRDGQPRQKSAPAELNKDHTAYIRNWRAAKRKKHL